ncbi:MAG: DUF4157 domain-containing protein [Anaerolineales bacterium]|nr:DUF4157 domain-containing protein [Anaerolineales bacterium]
MPTRSLHPDELSQVQQVFGVGLDTARVVVSEGNALPTWVGRIGAALKRQQPPKENAITIGNTSYFPRALTSSLNDRAWLMHELTHQWQYQHFGIRYLFEALRAPTYAYANENEPPDLALKRLAHENKTFDDLNREQQGDVVRDYFFALKDPSTSSDLTAWDPYLHDLRLPPP